jgi:signal transduction histidine kinase
VNFAVASTKFVQACSRSRGFSIAFPPSHHSSKLEYLGIEVAARSLCKELSQQDEVQIDLRTVNVPRKLPSDITLCLFRVLQEALRNATKHSGSRHFVIELSGTEKHVQLWVRDAGIGFDLEKAVSAGGLGLVSMMERVRSVTGELSVESEPNCGTTIHVEIPIPAGEVAIGSPFISSGPLLESTGPVLG